MILKSEDSLIYWKFIMISSVISFLKKQVKQKKKLLLKSLFILLLWFSFMPQQTYFSVNEVYAAGTEKDNDEVQKQREALSSLDTFMQAVSDIAFALLWPLVALAGLAMDNTLIYGSFMWLDVSLWNIWQIVRSFANYTLWFLLLIWVLRYNLSWKDSISGIKLPDLLKKVLIASVLIQASWFIMMVLVDLSTIMTYGVGWLPISVLWEKTLWSWDDSRMFKMNVDLSLWDYDSKIEWQWDSAGAIKYYWHVTWSTYVAPCKTVDVDFWWNDGKQAFVIGREFIELPWTDGKTSYTMKPWYCMYYWALVTFNDFYPNQGWSSGDTYWTALSTFSKLIEDTNNDAAKKLVDAGIIFPISTWKIPYLSGNKATFNPVELSWKNGDKLTYWNKTACNQWIWIVSARKDLKTKKWNCLYGETDITFSNLLKKANSMTWPFAALYSSLSVYSNLQVDGKWLWQKFVITFVNVCFSALLVLPLVALVVVLFTRIWLLWLAIALSPFLVLVKVFSGMIKLPWDLDKYLNFGELIKLLLAPVLISFAVWMSMIFMSVLKNSVWVWPDESAYLDKNNTKEFYKNFENISWIKVSWTDLDLLWFIKLKLDSTMINLSWMISMFFWLWITWFLLFRAIKQTAIWKNIWTTLQNLWETFIKTTPIIPVGKNWLSLKWLENAPEQIFSKISDDRTDADWKRLQSLLDIGKDDYEKMWSRFVRSKTISFNDAFEIQDKDYWDTDKMIKRLDGVYRSEVWWNRADEIAGVYKSMLSNAQSKDSANKIIDHLNEKWDSKINVNWEKFKVWDTEYTVWMWKDWKYVLQGGWDTDAAK